MIEEKYIPLQQIASKYNNHYRFVKKMDSSLSYFLVRDLSNDKLIKISVDLKKFTIPQSQTIEEQNPILKGIVGYNQAEREYEISRAKYRFLQEEINKQCKNSEVLAHIQDIIISPYRIEWVIFGIIKCQIYKSPHADKICFRTSLDNRIKIILKRMFFCFEKAINSNSREIKYADIHSIERSVELDKSQINIQRIIDIAVNFNNQFIDCIKHDSELDNNRENSSILNLIDAFNSGNDWLASILNNR